MENQPAEITDDKNFVKNKWLITIPATLPVLTQKIPATGGDYT